MFRLAAIALLLLSGSASPNVEFTIPVKHRLVEGIATDGRTVWVSSILDRTLVARTRDGMRTIAMPKGTLHPMDMAWDAQHGWLWIATDCPDLPGVAKCDRGALIAIDATGALKASIAPDNGPFHPGDVSIGNGAVFVSDSSNGAVYRWQGDKLTTVIAPGIGKSAQGSVLTPDGKSLIVADYSKGVASIDLATGARTLLPAREGSALRGLDGLVRHGDIYYAIYNGDTPAALFAFRIVEGTLAGLPILQGGALVDPTQLVVDGDRLLIVADSGWATAAKPNAAPRTPAPILSLPTLR